jgi:Major Facilitator Superfamily
MHHILSMVLETRSIELMKERLYFAAPAHDVPWGEFFKSAPVWAIICAHFCFNWGYYTLLAWLPSYFELSLGLNVESSSLLTLIPYIAMICMTPFVGPVADGLVSKGWKVTNVRKLAQVWPDFCQTDTSCLPTFCIHNDTPLSTVSCSVPPLVLDWLCIDDERLK